MYNQKRENLKCHTQESKNKTLMLRSHVEKSPSLAKTEDIMGQKNIKSDKSYLVRNEEESLANAITVIRINTQKFWRTGRLSQNRVTGQKGI